MYSCSERNSHKTVKSILERNFCLVAIGRLDLNLPVTAVRVESVEDRCVSYGFNELVHWRDGICVTYAHYVEISVVNEERLR